MKQILVMMMVVVLVGCGKKEAPKGGIKVKEQRSTPYQELPKAGAWVSDPSDPNNVKIEAVIRIVLKKPTGELTKADLEKVTNLSLDDKELTSVKALKKLTKLTVLNLGRNKLTDVTGLKKLTQLKLYSNKLTEIPTGLENLNQLTGLSLNNNQLTNVKGLEKLAKLTGLNLHTNPELTKAQIDELQKALPKCEILSNPTK